MILEIKSISLYRNKKQIFDNFNLILKKNQTLLLVGENGVGKTSLMDMLVGLIEPEKGSVKINGISVNNITNKSDYFTYLPHKDSLKENLSVEENLRIWLDLNIKIINLREFQKKLEFFEIFQHKDQLIRNLSFGQRKKVSLTKLLFSTSKLWLLDEPFNGIDEKTVKALKKLLHSHTKKDGSILLSSHIDPKIKHSRKIILKKKIVNLNFKNIDRWEVL